MAQHTCHLCFLMHQVTKACYLSVRGQSSAEQCCLPWALLDSGTSWALYLWCLSRPQHTLIAVTLCLGLTRGEFGPSDY